jgi:hypothetical protein
LAAASRALAIQGLFPNKTSKQMLESLCHADHITTTTSFLASIIQGVNKNVTVLQNAIDPCQPQFEIKKKVSEKIRFGWVGGASHVEDIALMKDGFARLNSDKKLANKYQLFLMGFNPKDETGIYEGFEKIFLTNLIGNDDTYYRINAANVYSYAQGYNLFDVALAPLANTLFNNCKSELKMIEAGFMKKAIIVSDVMPYKIMAKPGQNCLTARETNYRLS